MLFNKSNNGAKELRDRTGAYYANNDFTKIETDVILAEQDIIKLVGNAVYKRAKDHYNSSAYKKESPSEAEALNDMLVQLLQIPIAYRATFNFYQSNLVSHKDTGRNVSIDPNHEKMAWEWMLDRDDQAHLSKIKKTTDMLISWLETNNISEWLGSDNRKATRELFVNSEQIFQNAYPIDSSPRFFYTVLSWNREVQTKTIKKALGSQYDLLLASWKYQEEAGSGSGSANGGIPAAEEPIEGLLEMVQQVIPLFVMIMAVKRLSLQALPDSVVQQYKSDRSARSASAPAMKDIIEYHVTRLKYDADIILDDIKKLIQSADPEAGKYQLLPENDEKNKYFRT